MFYINFVHEKREKHECVVLEKAGHARRFGDQYKSDSVSSYVSPKMFGIGLSNRL